jgi:N-acetylglucosaminyldiphosphoundecaprenol N-acetyl-beta-D-mannosaminyltransferase
MSARKEIGFPPRHAIAGVLISSATYASATDSIIQSALAGRSALVAATSVHGVSMAAIDACFGRQLNAFDMLTPDGQPVRWALNLSHNVRLRDRVYGPTLMLRVCEAAAREHLPVYLYGGRPQVLERLARRLPLLTPGVRVAGQRSPPFRALTADEDRADICAILDSGARIVFVGLGCPRQEQWAYQHRSQLPVPIVCVGAAFDFHAGVLPQAPAWMQASGLEWFFRLLMEPRRLGRRYAMCIPIFIFLLTRDYASRRCCAARWRSRYR